MKGVGRDICELFPITMLIYGHKTENILVFMSARTDHTWLSGLTTLAVALRHVWSHVSAQQQISVCLRLRGP